MPLVIEDGTNVAGSNSFVSRAAIIAYATDRGVILVDDATTDVIGIKAMDYINSQCFAGETAYLNQVMPFPRKGVICGDEADDYVYTIPFGLQRAQLQLSVDIANGIDVNPSRGAVPQVKSKQVGPLKKEFFEQSEDLAYLPIVAAALQPYLCGQGAFSITTYRK